MILSLTIYAILATIAFVCAVVAPHTRWGSKHQALGSGVKPSRRQLRARSDFEKARDWLEEHLNDPKGWSLGENGKKDIDEKLAAEEDFTIVDIVDDNVDYTFKNQKKSFRMSHFSPAEQAEMVDVYYDAWAKRVDKYVESKLAVDNAKVIAARKHQSRIEARKSTTELVEGTDSWDAEFAEAQADNSGTEKQSVKILKSIGRGLSSALLPQ